MLALVGPSGCGKSTLLSVLLGLVTPESGSVRVGGVELADLDLDAWRARLAWVPQRPHLFKASIAQNVRLARSGASTEEVWAAIAEAGLTDAVRNLPRGLDTVLGDHGAGLSAGERQRVALARAFLRDAPLLLLDEPTANLDGQTERDVVEAIRRLSRGRTVVVVAHRPALIDPRRPRAPARAGGGRGVTPTLSTDPRSALDDEGGPEASAAAHTRDRSPRRGAPGARDAARRGRRRRRDRPDRDLGLADLALGSASTGVGRRDRHRRRAVLRPRERPVPLRRAAGRSRRGLPRALGDEGQRLRAPRAPGSARACRRSAAAICSHV